VTRGLLREAGISLLAGVPPAYAHIMVSVGERPPQRTGSRIADSAPRRSCARNIRASRSSPRARARESRFFGRCATARSLNISQRQGRAPRLLPSGADRHDLIGEGCETAVRRLEPTGLIDVD
jgi:hypothetical protein